jgi:hypothetical protein
VELTYRAKEGEEPFYLVERFGKVALAGRYVAYSSSVTDVSCKADCPPGYDGTTTRVGVVSPGRRRSRTILIGGTVIGTPVVSSLGRVAWASRASGTAAVSINGSASGSRQVVLDRGAVDPASLRIELSIVSWVRDGLERFARIGPRPARSS